MTDITADPARFIAPVPVNAPQWPRFHHGPPQYVFHYRDAEGRVLFHVLRWRLPDGRKTFLPLTVWQSEDDTLQWQFKGPPAPRPLYRLDHLGKNPTAPVLVVEGEHTAEVAAKLLPDYVVTTSINGSGAAHHSDWSPLANRAVTIWPDNDEAGAKYAREVAQEASRAGAATIAIVDVPADWPQGWDLADAPPDGVTFARVKAMLAQATPAELEPETPTPDASPLTQVEEEIAALAKLSALDYEQLRKDKAKALNIRAAELDKYVRAARGPVEDDDAQGKPFTLQTVEPWPTPVAGDKLLDALSAAFNRHLALVAHADHALALWTLHTWLFRVSFITPRLALTSPLKRCGKTTTLRLVGRLANRSLLSANASTSSLFRVIERDQPTLLLDEADTFIPNNEDLRGLLNSGNARDGKFIRTVGEKHDVRMFSTWAPVAIAAIGSLPNTIEDRSIMVPMRRALPGEVREPLRLDRPCEEWTWLKQMALRWARDNEDALNGADPAMPQFLNDRASDNWRPLIAIADQAGGDWPARARAAAVSLATADEQVAADVELLRDIRGVFDIRATDRLSSQDLVGALIADPERPWATLNRGQPLDQAKLAKRLRMFGIEPTTIRFPNDVLVRGYLRERLTDAFDRYL